MAKNNHTYVDGFVIVIPKKNLAAYKKMAEDGARMWKKAGALDYVEAVGEDINPRGMKDEKGKEIKTSSFPKMTKLKSSETIVFSYIVFKSRAHRDAVNKKVMDEMNKQADKYKDFQMPFDMAKMAYGGFKIIVNF